jgi:hypothetical protein
MPNWKKVITSGSDAALNSLNVTTSLTASGLIYPAADNGEESFIQTDGNGNLSLQYVKTIYEEVVNGETTNIVKGTPVYVSGSVGAAAKVFRADAGNTLKMPVIYVVADTIAPAATGRGIALGLIKGVDTTGYPAGTEIYVAVGGGWTSTRPTGSAIVQTLGYVTKEGAGGMGVILNPGPNSLPNLPAGNVWVGNSNALPVATATSSIQNVISASFATTAGSTTAVAGTTNYVSKFTSGTTIGNSQIFDNGTGVGIGNTSPAARLDVRAQGALSTDIAFRVRNSANTLDLFEVNGLGTATIQGSLFVARSYLNTSDLQIVASGGISGINVRTNSSGRFSIITNYSGGNYTSFLVGTGTNNPTTELMCFDHTNSRIGIGTTSPSAKLDIDGTLRQAGSITASGAIARGSLISPTLVAAANNDVLVGLDIAPTFTNGAFTGVTNYNLRSGGIAFRSDGVLNWGNTLTGNNRGFLSWDTNLAFVAGVSQLALYTGGSNRLHIFNNGNIGINTITDAGFRLDVNGTARVSGNTQITGSLNVAGTTRLSGSFNTAISGSILTVQGSGSAQPVFTVQGSQGELFSVTDSLSGSLFSVNDISGLPILEVFSDNTTLLGNYQDPMLITTAKVVQTNSGSFTMYSLPTESYDTAFFEYSVRSGSNARAGTIMAIQSGSAVNFTETTTTDFGSTSAISFAVVVTGSNMALTGSSTSGAWTIKTIVRGI